MAFDKLINPTKHGLILFLAVFALFLSACSIGKHVRNSPKHQKEAIQKSYQGVVSWYGRPFHGRRAANGERYNMFALTAAHKTLPFGSLLRLTNPATQQTVTVRITDRGPFIKGRELDVSYQAAKLLGFFNKGVTTLKIEVMKNPASEGLYAANSATPAKISTDAKKSRPVLASKNKKDATLPTLRSAGKPAPKSLASAQQTPLALSSVHPSDSTEKPTPSDWTGKRLASNAQHENSPSIWRPPLLYDPSRQFHSPSLKLEFW